MNPYDVVRSHWLVYNKERTLYKYLLLFSGWNSTKIVYRLKHQCIQVGVNIWNFCVTCTVHRLKRQKSTNFYLFILFPKKKKLKEDEYKFAPRKVLQQCTIKLLQVSHLIRILHVSIILLWDPWCRPIPWCHVHNQLERALSLIMSPELSL